MRTRTVLLVVILSLGSTAPAFSQACPLTTLNCIAPQQVSTPTGNCSYGDCLGGGGANFDAILGKVNASGLGGPCGGSGGASVETGDEFRVIGIAPGTPISIKAVFAVSGGGCPGGGGWPCCFGRGSGFIRDAFGTTKSASAGSTQFGCGSITTSLLLDVQSIAGDPFRLVYGASGSGTEGGSGSMSGTLHFEGLPPGSSIVSCRGFVQDFPVPAVPTTWARTKAFYR